MNQAITREAFTYLFGVQVMKSITLQLTRPAPHVCVCHSSTYLSGAQVNTFPKSDLKKNLVKLFASAEQPSSSTIKKNLTSLSNHHHQ